MRIDDEFIKTVRRSYMSGFVIIWLIVIGVLLYRYYENDKVLGEKLERLKSLPIEEKKLEIMKLQTLMTKYQTSHVLHFLICIFSIGLWVIPWFLIANNNSSKRSEIEKLITEM
jgi:hypothetical protein